MQRMPSRRALAGVVLLAVLAAVPGACSGATDATDAPLVTGEPPTARVPIIVDTDVDVSDLAALAVLLRDPKVDVRAVTIVPTGTGVTNCASGRLIVQYVLEEFGAETIPIAWSVFTTMPESDRIVSHDSVRIRYVTKNGTITRSSNAFLHRPARNAITYASG